MSPIFFAISARILAAGDEPCELGGVGGWPSRAFFEGDILFSGGGLEESVSGAP